MAKLRLQIVSQARQLLDIEVDSVTVPGHDGELTILPKHIPLFCPIEPGELHYLQGKQLSTFLVSRGFLDVDPHNVVTVITDEAMAARDISEQKAQEAIEKAQAVLITSRDRQELVLAEASLKRALLEMKVAQKSKKTTL